MDEDSTAEPVIVPPQALSTEALRRVIESFVLREGTDYGARERSFDSKVEELLARVRRGEARVVYNFDSQSADIVAAEPNA